MTNIQITPKWSDVKPSGHYVYVHYKASNNKPFYVGKGLRGRWLSKNGRNKWWARVASKHGVVSEFVQDDMAECDAFLLEMWIIALFRHRGESLVNLTDGGEGATGNKQSEGTKKLRAMKMSGENHPFYGKNLSEEHCRNLSLSHIGKMKGVNSPSYKADKFTFWNIDGRMFHGTRNEFCNHSGLTSGGVSRIVLGGRKHEKGWYVSPVEKRKEEIFDRRSFLPDGRMASGVSVYSNMGESFGSCSEAAVSVSGPNASGDLILMACNGVLRSAYGRTWSFNSDGPFGEYIDPRRLSGDAKFKTIECSNGMVFIGAKNAAEWLSKYLGRAIGASAIYQAIKNGSKSGGYSWRYIDG